MTERNPSTPPPGFPSTVQVLHRQFRVYYVDPDHPNLNDDDTTGDENDWCLGTCIESSCSIWIDRTQAPDTMRDTLAHEIIHAVYRSMPGLPRDDHDDEEDIVLFATAAAFAVIGCGSRFWDKVPTLPQK